MITISKRSRWTIPLISVVLCAAVSGVTPLARAHQKQSAPPKPSQTTTQTTGSAGANPGEQAQDDLFFKGPYKMSADDYVVDGHDFVFTRADSTTTGEHAHYKSNADKKTGVLDADGNLVYEDPKHRATCNKAHVDTKTKVAIFTENVVLVLKPDKPAPGAAAGLRPALTTGGAPITTGTGSTGNSVTAASTTLPAGTGGAGNSETLAAAPAGSTDDDRAVQKRRGATVTCDRMEDQYRKKFIKLTGHLICRQQRVGKDGKTEEQVLTAEHAEYNGKSEVLVLFGPVDGHDFKGQEFHSPNDVTVGTTEGKETLEGRGGRFSFFPDEENDDDSSPDAKGDAEPANAKPADTGKAPKGQR